MTNETSHQVALSDSHDFITVIGAHENNLKGIDVTIPKRRLTVFTGVSGSGKSSLVFSTIAAESQRLINETYSAFVQGFMPTMTRPDVDLLEGLTTAIIVDQQRLGGDPRSTVGTQTDSNALLRILFSRFGKPYYGSPNAFSFNVPSVRASGSITVEKGNARAVKTTFQRLGGMCSKCEGRGTVSDLDLSELYDENKSLNQGAIKVPGYGPDSFWTLKPFTDSGFLDPDKAINQYSKKELHDFLYHEPVRIKVNNVNVTYEGLIPKIQKSMLSKDQEGLQPHIKTFIERVATFSICNECDGTRLNEGARSSKINGLSIADVCAMQVSDLNSWIKGIDEPSAAPLCDSLSKTFAAFVEIGLGYLTLNRPTSSLSGGEAQRTKMIGHLGSSLTDVTYIFDEPTIGLHPHDIERVNQLLLRLRDKGNTVLVVEHKPEMIEIADHVIDLGPGAGSEGGRVCFSGSVNDLILSDTLTAKHFGYRACLKPHIRSFIQKLEIRGANSHNLKSVDVDIPLGILVVVTGVAGSGKSSLLAGSVAKMDQVVYIDQSPIKGSRRSNPATYTGLLEPIRKAFAKANGLKPALFSSNSEGACPNCNGAGVIYSDLAIMAGASVVCDECDGKRFLQSVLEYKLGGKDISEVLSMSANEVRDYFGSLQTKIPLAEQTVTRLIEVGLGYIRIGQPLTSLSGGERQRLKLATQMAEEGDIYILDEPTTGLHLADIEKLLHLLDRLVDGGKSVIVIEHHQAVMAHADWIIDLGPGAGHNGGEVVFNGPPSQLVEEKSTLTGKYLAKYLEKKRLSNFNDA
ncbi:ATP-binding cassette domain-containing protein [Acidithrix ferrooxidans]|uniref:UvrABC system protein A n=2 Tax=root TaxID=1 RepID=A0A0D8HEH6_9ACTN|nr:excinuclease ABC subunit UvrA [Acidithrix ferrooxidans]ATZ76185.1 excinuclease UvrABC ATPase subunit [uncultured Acidithrix sp.]KJF16345.1 UvrABC system protein A [Acidithrix ferrooxidans]